MSTPQTQRQPQVDVPPSQAKANTLVTGIVTGISDPVTTGNGEGFYDVSRITITPTRRSRAAKGQIMFRPEMFAFGKFKSREHYGYAEDGGFVPSKYASQQIKNSRDESVPAGKSFLAVYGMNVAPTFKLKDKNVVGISKFSPASYIAGGNLNGWYLLEDAFNEAQAQIPAYREPSEFGFQVLTPTEIVAVLRMVAQRNPIEQIFELRQQTDRNGDLTDFYEVATSYGELTPDSHNAALARVEKTKNEKGNRRVTLGYSVS